DGLGDRRNCRGRNQDKVESKFLRAPQCGGGRHHLSGAVGEHRADFAHADGLIHILSAILPARRKVSTWIHWLIVFCGMAVTDRKLRGERNRSSLEEKRDGQALQSSRNSVWSKCTPHSACEVKGFGSCYSGGSGMRRNFLCSLAVTLSIAISGALAVHSAMGE